jgi:hypothetical protein
VKFRSSCHCFNIIEDAAAGAERGPAGPRYKGTLGDSEV